MFNQTIAFVELSILNKETGMNEDIIITIKSNNKEEGYTKLKDIIYSEDKVIKSINIDTKSSVITPQGTFIEIEEKGFLDVDKKINNESS